MRSARLFIADHPKVFAIPTCVTAVAFFYERSWQAAAVCSAFGLLFSWGMLARAEAGVVMPLGRNRTLMTFLFWLNAGLLALALVYPFLP